MTTTMILKLELAEQNARKLLGLIDIAVKAGGLQVAADAVLLSSIIADAGERA